MGTQAYDNLVIGKYTANEAYREACDDMNCENGHQDGYSGDIQTSCGFSKRSDNPRYGTKSFEKWEEKILEDADKDDCWCIEITGAVATRLKGRRWKGRKGVKVYYFFGMGRS